MKLSNECTPCIVNWVYERTSPHVQETVRSDLRDRISRIAGSEQSRSANVGLLCNRAVYSATEFGPGAFAYYSVFKQQSNEQARKLLPFAEKYIDGGKTERERVERACVLAAAGNVAPLAAPSAVFTFQEVVDVIEGRRDPVLIGDVYDAVLGAHRVLYITDNAGEVGFDSLLLKAVKRKGAYVTLVVKEDAFFEDTMMSDAHYFHLDQVVDEIVTSKGFFAGGSAPSSVLEMAYAASDLIIAKGTGSFETLRGETMGKKVIFMLKVKCGPISRDIKVEEGRIVVKVEG
jgi:uncharacterized protein with ATP-grasp and redox domains